MQQNANGAIIYRGPSLIDGAPVVVVVTGLRGKSANRKTGDMLQTWILRDDVDPMSAIKSGADVSICGDCMHRPANCGSCYVTVWQAPLNVWRTAQRGTYAHTIDSDALATMGEGRNVRLGSYGDPAAIPFHIWQALVSRAAASTGYSHQWRTANPALQTVAMASVDSPEEAAEAQAMGWRTFRVRTSLEPVMNREFVCPASHEAGRKTDCANCRACGGLDSRAKANPVIIAHGTTARRFALTRSA